MMEVGEQVITDSYTAYNGDCCEVVAELPDESIDFSIYSPPFSDLYSYSDSIACMSFNENDEQFFQHYKYLIEQLYRVTQPGRLSAVHCMNLPKTKTRDGVIGLRDFRGGIIREHEAAGWIYHSEVCIWKDPVLAMQRTKAIGLLHKQVCKDSSISRQGLPDYVVVFRKPGVNPKPIAGPFEEFIGDPETFENTGTMSIDVWQRYASPVWHDIRQTRTLNNYREGKDDDDTKHICPLQLDVIERCLELWSNPNDVVLSPFMGVGSEGYCSVQRGRRFVGVELKTAYFDVAVKNLKNAASKAASKKLF
jgi:hypothetical protein